jgi:hypothetical protein
MIIANGIKMNYEIWGKGADRGPQPPRIQLSRVGSAMRAANPFPGFVV